MWEMLYVDVNRFTATLIPLKKEHIDVSNLIVLNALIQWPSKSASYLFAQFVSQGSGLGLAV